MQSVGDLVVCFLYEFWFGADVFEVFVDVYVGEVVWVPLFYAVGCFQDCHCFFCHFFSEFAEDFYSFLFAEFFEVEVD